MLYRLLFRLVLQRIPPETAHALAARGLGPLGRVRRRPDPRLRVEALGLTFPSPLGVAAGLDKDCTTFAGLGALGFGFVEVGTLTARAQAGNPPPRVARLIADRALWNSMGFPNPGAPAAAQRLARRSGTLVGVNVGKSRAVDVDAAGADYRECVRAVAPVADYLVLNVSSPNTPGLRAMQSVARLAALLDDVEAELRTLGRRPPLLVKLAPDLSEAELDAIADLALERELDGLIAVNTTLARDGLTSAAPPTGGVSGAPLKPRALAVLRRLRARVGDRLVLISVGGIETPDDAWERIRAGATLVQAYTGFIYGGPLWPARINRALARRVTQASARSIGELVGADAPAELSVP